jgi:hypothetical protein
MVRKWIKISLWLIGSVVGGVAILVLPDQLSDYYSRPADFAEDTIKRQ